MAVLRVLEPHQLPWFVVGPLIGIVPVALYVVANKHLGASGAYLQAAKSVTGRPTEPWRSYYFVGLVIGVAVGAALDSPAIHLGYAFMTGWLPIWAVLPILFASGVAMGYGARWAGGCTSGHGLCGVSIRSAGSLIATVTFFSIAIAVSLALHFISGGRA